VGEGVQSIMCSPLVVRERVLGALQVDTADAESPFTPDDLRLLVTVAGQTAIAAENVRLQREFVARERLAAVGQALSSVAHCIKNTLNTVAGGTYIVDLGLRDDDLAKVGKGWDMVKRSTGFMAQLVKDILTYCRRGGLSRTKTDVGQLLRETLSMAEQPALEAGVELSLSVPEDLPPVEVDPVALKRAVLNLLVNAVEACSEGCQVQASAEVAGGGERLRLLVSDDGPGMPEEVRQHLFEPFYTTKGNKGTGLGLALVKKVVDGHRGSIEVQSGVGEGTTFVILLPVEGTATQLRGE
jgi:signal transduction histidine kinase